MKNLIVHVVLIFTIACAQMAYGQTASKEKTISGHFSADKGELFIDNRYGKLEIHTWDKNEVTVDITITARANSADDAQKLLDQISIIEPNDRSNGIYYKTIIGNKNKNVNNSEMRIDYVINMPRKQTAEFTNKFGDIEIADVTGKLTIDLEYGALKTGEISGGDNDIKVGYGSAVIASLETGTISCSYSKLSIGKAGRIDVTNEFEKTTITTVRDLHIEQKYGDLKIGSVSQLNGSVQYAGLVVEKLLKSVEMKVSYGSGIRFEYVAPGVDNVNINSSFSNLYFHFDNDASLSGNANMSFGNFTSNAPNVVFTASGPGMPGQGGSCKVKVGSGRGTIALNESYGNVTIK